MTNQWTDVFRNRVRKMWLGLALSSLVFIASPYVNKLCAVTWRLDCILYTFALLSILYFGIFHLKCPKCGVAMHIGDAFSIRSCKECGSTLRRDNKN